MRVLHVNNVDLNGRRFNGYDLISALSSRDIECQQVVLTKLSDNPAVTGLLRNHRDADFHQALTRVERLRGMNDLLYPWGRVLEELAEFEQADVVHYHLIHNQVVSLLDLPWLTHLKPSVWTFHDGWALAGGCLHPATCDEWVNDCRRCNQIDLTNSNTERMWQVKKHIYPQVSADIVVASNFMQSQVRKSALGRSFENVHLIPFGIEAGEFWGPERQTESRRLLRIPESDSVVLLRASRHPLKGLTQAIDALRLHPPSHPTTILTVDESGLLDCLRDQYNILDLGWVREDERLKAAYTACDLLLMPSLAEGFGMMALEAMASSRPVVCFEDTAVASLVEAPTAGTSVAVGDARALRAAIDALLGNQSLARAMGHAGQQIACSKYRSEHYLDALASLYRRVAAKHGQQDAETIGT